MPGVLKYRNLCTEFFFVCFFTSHQHIHQVFAQYSANCCKLQVLQLQSARFLIFYLVSRVQVRVKYALLLQSACMEVDSVISDVTANFGKIDFKGDSNFAHKYVLLLVSYNFQKLFVSEFHSFQR